LLKGVVARLPGQTNRGDLFQIAAPDTLSNAAKQEISMTELTRFQRRLIKFQSPTFNFERASVALLSSFKKQHHLASSPAMDGESRNPLTFRMAEIASQGAYHG
jgi:hypothetical protein